MPTAVGFRDGLWRIFSAIASSKGVGWVWEMIRLCSSCRAICGRFESGCVQVDRRRISDNAQSQRPCYGRGPYRVFQPCVFCLRTALRSAIAARNGRFRPIHFLLMRTATTACVFSDDGRYAVFGEVSYSASLEDAAANRSYKGTGGFRIVW